MDRSTIRGKSDAVVVPVDARSAYINALALLIQQTYGMKKSDADLLADRLRGAHALLRRNKELLAAALVMIYDNRGQIDSDRFTLFYNEYANIIRKNSTIEEEKYMYALYRYVRYCSLYYSGDTDQI